MLRHTCRACIVLLFTKHVRDPAKTRTSIRIRLHSSSSYAWYMYCMLRCMRNVYLCMWGCVCACARMGRWNDVRMGCEMPKGPRTDILFVWWNLRTKRRTTEHEHSIQILNLHIFYSLERSFLSIIYNSTYIFGNILGDGFGYELR